MLISKETTCDGNVDGQRHIAGRNKSRKSLFTGVIIWGQMMQRWTINQAVLALSSREAEYDILAAAGNVSLGIKSLASELGVGV